MFLVKKAQKLGKGYFGDDVVMLGHDVLKRMYFSGTKLVSYFVVISLVETMMKDECEAMN